MKKQKLLILLLLPIVLVIGLFTLLASSNYSNAAEFLGDNTCDANGCSILPSSSLVIDAFNEPKVVNNEGEKDIFVPISDETEWASFRIFHPVGISLSDPGCSLPWGGTIQHNQSVTAFKSNQSCECISEVRVCDAGTLSGSYEEQTCVKACDNCTLPWGGSIAHGETVSAFNSSLNSFGCCESPIKRTCDNGTLSGSGSYNQGACNGDSITYNYNGSPWVAKCIEIGGLNWLDRNLGASRVAIAFDDYQSYGDHFQWGRAADGHQVSNSASTYIRSSSDQVAAPDTNKFIVTQKYPNDWRNPQNDNLWQGVSGVNNPCPTGFRPPTTLEWQALVSAENITNSATAYTSSLKLPVAGYRDHSSAGLYFQGSYGRYWSASPDGIYARNLGFSASNVGPANSNNRAYGFSLRCVRDNVNVVLKYSNTVGGSVSGSSVQTVTIGGNGSQVKAEANSGYEFIQWSDGVTTASRTDLNVTQDIDIVAEFEQIFVCGDNVIFYYNGSPVNYGTVLANDGHCWLDRNLGALRVATAFNDSQSYGGYFQWGRAADGHQVSNSASTDTLSSSDQVSAPDTAKFIKSPNNPYDWRNPQNDNLWQGVSGVNNPCPTGFRPPTTLEWQALVSAENITNSATAYNSSLKLPVAGLRLHSSAGLYPEDSFGLYWSASPNGIVARYLYFGASDVNPANSGSRAYGFSLRCFKD